MNKTGDAPGDACSSPGARPARFGGIKGAPGWRSEGAAQDSRILDPRCYSVLSRELRHQTMKNSESLAAATPGRVFNSPNDWAPQHLNTGKPLVSIQGGEVRFLLPDTMADWRYHLCSDTEHVCLTRYWEHIETGRPAFEWASEGKYGEISRLIVDLVDVHGLDQFKTTMTFGLTASVWIERRGGPVRHAGFDAHMFWIKERLPAGASAQ